MATKQAGPTVEELLADFSTPYWVKDTLRLAMTKDCVEAASALEIMARAMAQRCDKLLGKSIPDSLFDTCVGIAKVQL